MKKSLFIISVLIFFVYSCEKKKGKQFPPEPQIYYQSTTPDTINILDTASLTTIVFRFTDGDGDIAQDSKDSVPAIFVRDSRDTSLDNFTYALPFPYIAPNIRPDGGLEGTVALNLGRQYYQVWDSLHLALGRDTMVWSIYIEDIAGNKSNLITSDTIYIRY